MRILALAILVIGMASAAQSARAQTYDPNYPVCLQVYQSWKDFYFECSYTSLAQCNMSASGRGAQCIINPYYAGGKAPPGRRDPAASPRLLSPDEPLHVHAKRPRLAKAAAMQGAKPLTTGLS